MVSMISEKSLVFSFVGKAKINFNHRARSLFDETLTEFCTPKKFSCDWNSEFSDPLNNSPSVATANGDFEIYFGLWYFICESLVVIYG